MAIGDGRKRGGKTARAIQRLEGLDKHATRVLSVRLLPRDLERFEAAARRAHLRPAQLARQILLSWLE